MIIKGQSFDFAYETRSNTNGNLTADSGTHSIKIYYTNSSNQFTYNTSTVSPTSIGTGIYKGTVSSAYSDCDHVIVCITSSTEGIHIPVLQFYPVNLGSIAQQVWNYGNSSSTITSRTIDTTGIASAVWNENLSSYSTSGSAGSKVYGSPDTSTLVSAILDTNAGSHTTTGTIGAKISSTSSGGGASISTSDIAEAVWNYGSSSPTLTSRTISTTGIASAVWSENLSSYSTSGSAGSKVYGSPDTSTLVSAILDTTAGSHTTTGTIGAKISAQSSASVDTSSIAQAVWTYGNGTSGQNAVHRTLSDSSLTSSSIATAVWTYGDSEQTRTHHRSITSNTLVGSSTLALSNQVSVTVDSDDIEFEFPTTASIASAVWNYGQPSGSTSLTTRSLGTTASVDNTAIASAVWNSNTRTLSGTVDVSSSSIDDIQDGLATSTSIAAIPSSVWNFGNTYGSTSATTRSLSSAVTDSSVARAVWEYGNVTTGTPTEFRRLSGSSGPLSIDTASISSAVWGATTRTLSEGVNVSSASVSSIQNGLATSSSVSNIPSSVWNFGQIAGSTPLTTRSLTTQSSDMASLTAILTKVLGVLCHWKEENNKIIVYNDSNQNILEVPIVKDRYGDIVKMGSMP